MRKVEEGNKLMTAPAQIIDAVIRVRINQLFDREMTPEALFEATRGVWKVGPRREAVGNALATYRGEVIEVYRVDYWQAAGSALYPSRSTENLRVPGRWEFVGALADETVRSRYVGRSVKQYLPAGSRSPIVYVGC